MKPGMPSDMHISWTKDVNGKKYSARLVLIHVTQSGEPTPAMLRMAEAEHLIDPPHGRPVEGVGILGRLPASGSGEGEAVSRQVFESFGKVILDRAEQNARKGDVTDIKRVIGTGDPAQQIIECARREKADAIFLGSRGLGDLKGLLLGSVSHKVGQLAECTCVTVK